MWPPSYTRNEWLTAVIIMDVVPIAINILRNDTRRLVWNADRSLALPIILEWCLRLRAMPELYPTTLIAVEIQHDITDIQCP